MAGILRNIFKYDEVEERRDGGLFFLCLGGLNLMQYELSLLGINKSYGSLKANDNIDLFVQKGSIHTIIGENGAGKSTLMSILSGVVKADSGEIRKRGELIHINSPNDAAGFGIGMVYQEFMNFADLTALDNIIMGNEPLKFGCIDKKYAKKKVAEICEKYSFKVSPDMYVKKMSVSMLQQLEIVKILYRNADILILDEPTSVLTPQEIEGLFIALRSLKDKGKTIIIITHKLKEVLEIADEITVLKGGKVSGRLKVEEADEKKLAKLMVGREVLLNAQKCPHEAGEEILKIEGLSVKDDKGIERVKNASLTLRSGEIVGICGIAGSGESELVAALTGMGGEISKGSIFLCNKDITKAKISLRRSIGMGYVPQDRNRMGANREGSIWETAFMGHHIVSKANKKILMNRPQILDFTKKIIEEFKVKAGGVQEKVSFLSGGNLQKLVVGREFFDKYKLIVMEDPTRGVDVGAIEFIWKEILEYSLRGIAILLISHELSEVMQLSDRIFVMHQGELIELEDGLKMSEKEIGLYMLRGKSDEKSSKDR